MIRQLFSKARTTTQNRPHVKRFQPRLDALEDRTLLTMITFNIDPSNSSLTLSADFDAGFLGRGHLDPQAPNSLTTSYEGTLTTDLDVNGQTIKFLDDGHNAVADDSGNWVPHPRYPANYGGMGSISGAMAEMAFRGIVLSVTSGTLAIDNTGNFPSTQLFTYTSGHDDCKFTFFGRHGHTTFDLTNMNGTNGAAAGNLQVTDTQYELTVPVDFTASKTFNISGFNIAVKLELYGSITATAPLTSVPDNNTSTLGSLAVAATAPSNVIMAGSNVTSLVQTAAVDWLITTVATGSQKEDSSADNVNQPALPIAGPMNSLGTDEYIGLDPTSGDGAI
jgi:hypothetical protein